MLIDGVALFDSSYISNLIADSGTSFPAGSPGEMFYRTDLQQMYVYDGAEWKTMGTIGFDDLNVKAAVRAATTGNITLSGTQTVDGVALSVGDRVLVKNQSAPSQNGIYEVKSGAWTRTTDFDGSPSTEVKSGDFVFVTEGTVHDNSGWVLATNNPIQVGTTPLTFNQFTGAATLSAAGDTNQIQYNNAGAMAASAKFTWTDASTTLTLGSLSNHAAIQAATATTTGVNLTIGSGHATNGKGGTLALTAGNSAGTNAGGDITIVAGVGGGSAGGHGGNITITGGAVGTASSHRGGDVTIRSGTGTSSTGSVITIQGGVGPGGFSSGAAGDCVIAGGDGSTNQGAGPGGQLYLRGGLKGSSGGVGGSIILQTSTTTSHVERLRILSNGAWSVGSDGTSYGTSGQVLTSNGNAAPTWQSVAGGGGGTPGGATTQLQFNNAGTFGGDADLTWDSSGNVLRIGSNATPATIAPLVATSGAGANLSVLAGTGAAGSAGGNMILTGGNGGSTAAGGNIFIKAGGSNSASNGGYISFVSRDLAAYGETERLRILSNGAWSVGSNGTSFGAAGQVLTSNGNAAPTWQSSTTSTLNATGTYTRVSSTTAVSALVNGNSEPVLSFQHSGAPTNAKVVQFQHTSAGTFSGLLVNDAFNTGIAFFSVTRSGTTATNITLTGNAINFAGLTAGLQINGSAGTSGQVLTSNGDGAPTWASASASLTSTHVGYGSGANVLTGSATFTFNATTRTLQIGTDAARGTVIRTPDAASGSPASGSPDLTLTAGNGLSSVSHSGSIFLRTGTAASTNDGYVSIITGVNGGATSEKFRFLANGAFSVNSANGTGYGTSGQVLTSNGNAPPSWQTVSSGGGSITLTGDVTGTGTGSVATTLASVGTPGTYRSVTTDAKGRVTAGTNPTTLAGYGITDAAPLNHTHTFESITSKPTTVAGFGITDAVTSAQLGAASGVATLGADSKIPTSQLPALAITDTFVVASEAAMLALTAETGDVAVRTDLNKSFILRGASASTLADWQALLTPTDSVLSVNGQTGAVTLTSSNIAEGTNLYYTDERVRNAISVTGNGSYNTNTGVITINAQAAAAASELTGTTLASNVVSSSLTSVGTLSSLTVSGAMSAPTLSVAEGDITSASLTTSATTPNQVVHSMNASTFRSAKFMIQVTSGSAYQATEVIVIHNGTTAFMTEYGTVLTGTSLATFDTDISGGNLRLLVTPVNAVSTIKVVRTAITA